MTTKAFLLTLTLGSALFSGAHAQYREDAGPWVLGEAQGRFEVGQLIGEDQFHQLDQWVVQIEDKKGAPTPRVEVRNRSLDCYVPARGCTIWLKKKLKTRVTISYDVLCPTPKEKINGLRPTDINNFWMASDPVDADKGLFDPKRYDGGFGSYDKMLGYYASTGGGKNSTTRMRRYPRTVEGEAAAHLALTDKDGQKDFLIKPDQRMSVQLVAFDDLIQYIVDGRLVYEISRDDEIQIERQDAKGKRIREAAAYDLDRFPVYKEGYFGFRMVGTHHIYSNFRVHELEPVAGEQLDREKVEVSSLDELREAATRSHQHVTMKPGTYTVGEIRDSKIAFHFSGSNNYFDLSGVTINMPIEVISAMSDNRGIESDRGNGQRRRNRDSRGTGTYVLSGNHITIKGGVFENTYPDGKNEVTDFGAYNRDRSNYPERGTTELRISGDDNRLIGCRMIVRGSFPYGYGNIYGIGSSPVLSLKKHCGIQITGNRSILDHCDLKMEAFGHAIYAQSGADQTTVRNTTVVGELRPSNDFYTEKHEDDLARRFDYQIQWPENVAGLAMPRDHMINLCEDAIRAYEKTGHFTVDNCRVDKTRGGIKLYLARSARISNCLVTDCVIESYSPPSRGTIVDSAGNAAYGPLLYLHMDSHHDARIELEVLPSEHSLGDHPLAAIKGHGHNITFTSADSSPPAVQRPIILGFLLRFDFLSVDFPDVPEGMEELFLNFAPDQCKASEITLNNRTPYAVVLGKDATNNRIESYGPIRDLGKSNRTRNIGSPSP
ncbi:DUF6250 domain-containing protein [Haloferula chungangensis]|uniref:DUF6250 domain-containing protein n=1 Tax=Haloferula chungangensis TaxID=1048331 RepID=A0ABW2L5I9_9BACT